MTTCTCSSEDAPDGHVWTDPQCRVHRYPYTHHGPAVHGSKMADYLISELSLREDHPELFEEKD